MRDPDKYMWHRPDRMYVPRIRPNAVVGIAWGMGLGALMWAALIWCAVG